MTIHTEWQPPSAKVLETYLMKYLRENRAKEYREMKKAGELAEYVALVVENTRKTANNLIECGVFNQEAWNRAIRQEIDRTESD